MNQLLQTGQSIQGVSSGLDFTVEEYLGGGSQGEVYRTSAANAQAAVKWFHPHYLQQDVRLRERLERAAEIGAPSDRFLWPVELTTSSSSSGFGYLMGLRETRFRSMADLVTRQFETSFRSLATAGFELANAFLQLHARGLCYRDISFGNVFFDPVTGEVQICDNDNVDIDGQPGSIGGTARFMAPEIVTGAATPSTQSDLFSLAILLFYLMVNHHPLEGALESAIRCFDLPAMTKLYGSQPVFIYDPANLSNRPVPGLHDNALALWPLYPKSLRALFTRAFTDGIHDPQHGRVRESEWRSAMIQLRDSIFYCTACGAENFYDADAITGNANSVRLHNKCWSCNSPLQLPPRIRIKRDTDSQIVMLNHNTRLYPHHTNSRLLWNFSDPTAEIRRHPKKADIWGLTNLTENTWTASTTSGDTITVPPDHSVTLTNGIIIHFGSGAGEVRL